MRASPESGRDRYWRKAFVSDDAYLNTFSISSREDQRDHAGIQEISGVQLSVGLVETAALRQRDEIQMRPEGVKFGVGN